ncbi:MAG: helix-turn-helix transcriptional regulator, partial [Bacteroidota bacterium]
DYGLTDREKEILRLMTDGLTKKVIADKLFVSYFTIDTHLKNIYVKLHVHTGRGAVAKVLKEHLL